MSPKGRRLQVASDRRRLAEQYPALFETSGSSTVKKPIHWGVLEAIHSRGLLGDHGQPIARFRIRKAIANYKRGVRYAVGLLNHDRYYDLDGNSTIYAVTVADRAWAQRALNSWEHFQAERDARARAKSDLIWAQQAAIQAGGTAADAMVERAA